MATFDYRLNINFLAHYLAGIEVSFMPISYKVDFMFHVWLDSLVYFDTFIRFADP
ncbi:hypothetical protein EMGBS15_13810 [Filimonas sp.]|nr:hypothetical protein EMGBS15_13810 [Filimonas sp.]